MAKNNTTTTHFVIGKLDSAKPRLCKPAFSHTPFTPLCHITAIDVTTSVNSSNTNQSTPYTNNLKRRNRQIQQIAQTSPPDIRVQRKMLHPPQHENLEPGRSRAHGFFKPGVNKPRSAKMPAWHGLQLGSAESRGSCCSLGLHLDQYIHNPQPHTPRVLLRPTGIGKG